MRAGCGCADPESGRRPDARGCGLDLVDVHSSAHETPQILDLRTDVRGYAGLRPPNPSSHEHVDVGVGQRRGCGVAAAVPSDLLDQPFDHHGAAWADGHPSVTGRGPYLVIPGVEPKNVVEVTHAAVMSELTGYSVEHCRPYGHR